MLTHLHVKNFALIEEVDIDFEAGFSVLSGETGAGKSIVVGALGLLIGGKASSAFVRSGQSEAVIEAVFDIAHQPSLQSYLEDAGLREGDELIVRRQLSEKGRSRIFANGKSITLTQLSLIGSYLIDLSGQHDQQVLLQSQNHLKLLDQTIADNHLSSYQKTYQDYLKFFKGHQELQNKQQDREQKLDFLTYQLKEIADAKLNDSGEEDNLVQEKQRVKNADRLFQLSSKAAQQLDTAEGSMREKLDLLMDDCAQASEADVEIEKGLALLKEAYTPLVEAGRFFADYAANLDQDPGRLDEIEARLFLIHQLKKKYGTSIEEILDFYQNSQKELDQLQNIDSSLKQSEEVLSQKAHEVLKSAQQLSKQRHKQAKLYEKEINKELKDLNFRHAGFAIQLDQPKSPTISDCGPDGFDHVHFYLSANPGEPAKPLDQTASGGELSRVLLAIKKVLRTSQEPITYVFDEIDAGIGGAVAEVVGDKIKAIAKQAQVLSVTHLPQIAAKADYHYMIKKQLHNRRTQTHIEALTSKNQRQDEIARMLGGVKITAKTKAHAREMLS